MSNTAPTISRLNSAAIPRPHASYTGLQQPRRVDNYRPIWHSAALEVHHQRPRSILLVRTYLSIAHRRHLVSRSDDEGRDPEHLDLEVDTTEINVGIGISPDTCPPGRSSRDWWRQMFAIARSGSPRRMALRLSKASRALSRSPMGLRPSLQAVMPIAAGMNQSGSAEDAIWAVDGWEIGADKIDYSVNASNLAADATIVADVTVSGSTPEGD